VFKEIVGLMSNLMPDLPFLGAILAQTCLSTGTPFLGQVGDSPLLGVGTVFHPRIYENIPTEPRS